MFPNKIQYSFIYYNVFSPYLNAPESRHGLGPPRPRRTNMPNGRSFHYSMERWRRRASAASPTRRGGRTEKRRGCRGVGLGRAWDFDGLHACVRARQLFVWPNSFQTLSSTRQQFTHVLLKKQENLPMGNWASAQGIFLDKKRKGAQGINTEQYVATMKERLRQDNCQIIEEHRWGVQIRWVSVV